MILKFFKICSYIFLCNKNIFLNIVSCSNPQDYIDKNSQKSFSTPQKNQKKEHNHKKINKKNKILEKQKNIPLSRYTSEKSQKIEIEDNPLLEKSLKKISNQDKKREIDFLEDFKKIKISNE
jgi:hypothetical protein